MELVGLVFFCFFLVSLLKIMIYNIMIVFRSIYVGPGNDLVVLLSMKLYPVGGSYFCSHRHQPPPKNTGTLALGILFKASSEDTNSIQSNTFSLENTKVIVINVLIIIRNG